VNCFPLTGWIFGSPLALDPDFDTSSRILPGAWDTLEADLRRHPPRFVIDTHSVASPKYGPDRFPRLSRLLAAEYREVFRSRKGIVFERSHSGAAASGISMW
jgi:hypothetical protein